METYKLCILCCGRNVEQYLPTVFSNFSTIDTWFKETLIVVFENDSSDNTHQLLKNWSNNKNKTSSEHKNAMNFIFWIFVKDIRCDYLMNLV